MAGKRCLIIVLPKNGDEHQTYWLRDPNQPQGVDCGWRADPLGHWLNDVTWDLLLLYPDKTEPKIDSRYLRAFGATLGGYGVVCLVYHSIGGYLPLDRAVFPDWFAAKYTRDLQVYPKARVIHTLRADFGMPESVITEIIERLHLSTKERKHLQKVASWFTPAASFSALARGILAPLNTLDEGIRGPARALGAEVLRRSALLSDAAIIEEGFAKARLRLYTSDSDQIRPSGTLERLRLSESWTTDAELCWARVTSLLPRSDADVPLAGSALDLYSRVRLQVSTLQSQDSASTLEEESPNASGCLTAFREWLAAFTAALTALGLHLPESSDASAAGA